MDVVEDTWSPIEGFVGLDDPETWLVDESTGLLYRRTTEAERNLNGWITGSYLVQGGDLANRSDAPDSMEIVVPYNDTVTDRFSLELRESRVGPVSVEKTIGHGTRVVEPTYYIYQSPVAQDRGAYLITSTQGWGLAGRAVLDDREVTLTGLSDRPELSNVSVPSDVNIQDDELFLVEFLRQPAEAPLPGCTFTQSMSSILATSSDACDDGDGGSGGGGGGGSDEIPYNYGMFGEGKWCTERKENGSNWNEKLSELGWTVQSGFSDTKAGMKYKWNSCWLFDTVDDAYTCDSEDLLACYHDDGGYHGHGYPYDDCAGDSSCYGGNVWSDVDHDREHYDFALLDVAHVIHAGGMSHPEPGWVNCGKGWNSDQGEDLQGAGVSADWINYAVCDPWVATHEVGHNFNALHCSADFWVPTVMAAEGDAQCPASDTSDRHNYFSDYNRKNRVNPCATDNECPRTERR